MAARTNVKTNERMIAAAAEAGASNLFLLVATADPLTVQVKKNYVANEVAKACDSLDPEEWGEALDRRIARSGDFTTALWNGDLPEALYHADGTNTRLLVRHLPDDMILGALADERGSMESARRWYEPVRKRYGFPDPE